LTKSEGRCRIDGVHVGEVSIDNLSPASPRLDAKYALINIESGDRYGAGTRKRDWSTDTQQKLVDLMLSMEKDIANDVFEGAPTTNGVTTTSITQPDDIPGL
jgi:hypothetical protein